MRFTLLSVALLAAGSGRAVQSPVPVPLPADRYETMLAVSPFALATPVEAPTAPKESPFANWIVTGLVTMRDDDGVERDFVTIRSRDKTEQFSLWSNETNADGVAIANVDRSPLVAKSTVTLRKGSEVGEVRFDEMALQAPAPAPAPVRQNAPNYPSAAGGAGLPSQNPTLGGSRLPNNGRIVVPRPNGAPASTGGVPRPMTAPLPAYGNPTLPGAQPAPGRTDGGRRIRVINSKP